MTPNRKILRFFSYCNNLIRSRCDCKEKPDSFDREIGSVVKLLIEIATKMRLLVYLKLVKSA